MFLKALAWFGLFLFTLFVIWSAWILNDIADPNSWWQGRLQGAGIFPFLISFSAFGLPFMLIGGLVAKPGYFWLAAIAIGSLQLILVIIFIIVTSGSPLE